MATPVDPAVLAPAMVGNVKMPVDGTAPTGQGLGPVGVHDLLAALFTITPGEPGMDIDGRIEQPINGQVYELNWSFSKIATPPGSY